MDTDPDNNSEKEKKTYSFYDVARRILLAGIGAIAISHDEVEVFIEKLVERGELAKRDGESLLKEVREKRMKHLHGEESHFQKRIEEFLNHLNVPAKKDFDELSGKISALEKKIDELTKDKS